MVAIWSFFFKPSLEVFTDGSHKGKWGSWAFVVVRDRNRIVYEASGRQRKTNSHRMEFQAAIEALKYIKSGTSVLLHTDSRELLKAMSSNRNKANCNQDQVDILLDLQKTRKVSWRWVKAHAGQPYNQRCDELCREVRRSL